MVMGFGVGRGLVVSYLVWMQELVATCGSYMRLLMEPASLARMILQSDLNR